MDATTHSVEGVTIDEAQGLQLELKKLGDFPRGLIVGLSKEMGPETEVYFNALAEAGENLKSKHLLRRNDVSLTKPAQVLNYAEDIELYEKEVDQQYGVIDKHITDQLVQANAGLFTNQAVKLTELDRALMGDTLVKVTDAKSIDLLMSNEKYAGLAMELHRQGYATINDRHLEMLNRYYSEASLNAVAKLNEQSQVLNRIVREASTVANQNKAVITEIKRLQNRKVRS